MQDNANFDTLVIQGEIVQPPHGDPYTVYNNRLPHYRLMMKTSTKHFYFAKEQRLPKLMLAGTPRKDTIDVRPEKRTN